MNQEIRGQQVSALIDGELSPDELRRVTGLLNAQPELRETTTRYRMIGDVMRSRENLAPLSDLAERISLGIAEEPAILMPRPIESNPLNKSRRIGGRSAASVALAASVAVVALLAAPQFRLTSDSASEPQVASVPPVREGLRLTGTRWDLQHPAVESKLNSYLVEHNEFAPAQRMQGLLPYVTVVGYDARR